MAFPSDDSIEPKVNPNFESRPPRSIDDLIGELNQAKQVFETEKPSQPPGIPGEPKPTAPAGEEPEPIEPMDPERAKRQGERLAKITDSILSNVAGMVAGSEDCDKYKASEGDRADIAEAWADISASSGIKMPPGVMLAILLLMTYIPKFKIAISDRRYNKLQSQMDLLQGQVDALQEERLKIRLENQQLKHDDTATE